MDSSFKIRDTSGWTMFVFGVLALLLGLIGLIRPEILLTILGFPVLDRSIRATGDFTIVFITASSMASFNMGVYYVLAALNDMKKFYTWTVPFRFVTFTVFTILAVTGVAPMRFIGVGLWEGFGALATGLSLYLDNKKATLQPVTVQKTTQKHRGRK
jgi:hypothetical protein